jgi:hypothetical protein
MAPTSLTSDPATSASERLLALKSLLHFVGDLHSRSTRPMNHDAGGNRRQVIAEGHTGNLHRFWGRRVCRAAW